MASAAVLPFRILAMVIRVGVACRFSGKIAGWQFAQVSHSVCGACGYLTVKADEPDVVSSRSRSSGA